MNGLVGLASADASADSAFVAMIACQLCLVAFDDVIVVVMIASKCHRQWPILCWNSSAHYISICLDSEIKPTKQISSIFINTHVNLLVKAFQLN